MADMLSGVGDVIVDGLQSVLYATVYKLLYYLAVGCCWIINLLYSMFEVMAGLSKVSYDGDFDYLINIFFSNTTVSKVYWGMALIGLTVGFAFAIAAVIKKLFDTREKEKRSYGQILTSLFKSALTILCMSLIVTMVLNATTILMQQINYVFINADDLGEEKSITYTEEEYAAMARALNTIGNFSLNPSYNNRYNINKCFNEVRLDLQYLKQEGVFDFHYVTKDVQGNTIATWQSALQKIANSASLERDLKLDVYHESVNNAILNAMELLKVNGSFKPLEEYQRQYQPSRNSIPMDRLLFLMSTMRAAKNDDYNTDPSLTDPLRGAYYYGEKSIYDLNAVNEDFDIGVAAFDYLILFLACYKMLETLITIILNCVGRIFNMLLLYLIAPIIIAVTPLDDGGKFKQWTTAFVVQSFSVFGTVISMRVLLLFMPIVIDPKLVLFTNPIANLLTKLVIILGAFEVSEKATNLITGILADNAGWQSITAGDMSATGKSLATRGKSLGKAAMLGAAGMAGGAVMTGVKAGVGAGLAAGYGTYFAGKGVVSGGRAIANKISSWRNGGGSEGGKEGGGDSKSTDGKSSGGDFKSEQLPQNQHDVGNGNSGDSGDSVSGPTQQGEGDSGMTESQRSVTDGTNQTGESTTGGSTQSGESTTGVGSTQQTDANSGMTESQRSVTGGTDKTGGMTNAQGTTTTGGTGQTSTTGKTGGGATTNSKTNGGNKQGVPQRRTIAPGIADRVAAAEAHFSGSNTRNGGTQQGAPQSRSNAQDGGTQQGAPQSRSIAPGIADRVAAAEAHFSGSNAQDGGTQQGAPQSRSIAPGIADRVAAVEAHMNPTGNNASAPDIGAKPTKAPPVTVRNRQKFN